jgi:hypothetical protein
LFDTLHIYNCFKINDALSTLPSIYALKYPTKEFHAKEDGLKLRVNRAHQLMACADKYNLFVEKNNTSKKNKRTLLEASKEAGLQQDSSHIFAGVPKKKFGNFSMPPIYFYLTKKVEIGKLAKSGD